MRFLYLILYYFIARHLPGSDSLYSLGAKKIRYALCKELFDKVGKNANIEHGAFFGSGKGIEIGDFSGLGINCRVAGPLKIGKYLMMGPDVLIYTSNHEIGSTDTPMIFQGDTPKKAVIIEDDVWIGARTIILPGITIYKGAVVAAGAVVTKDVPSYAIVGGNPARVLKYRTESNKQKEMEGR